ncbi:MAG: phosphomannomutase/phosphoglucomutase [Gammaproteobacteria bacterium]|nr:MAG: phosphomannomutase/phosphoglucomutase [Gammaproteobacteria bacterium]
MKIKMKCNLAGSIKTINTFMVIAVLILTGPVKQAAATDEDHNDQAKVDSIARQVGATLKEARDRLTAIAGYASLKTSINNNKDAELRVFEDLTRDSIPYALKVRVLSPDVSEIDTSSTPYLSYACLDITNKAGETMKQTPIEVHSYGSPQQHIDIAQPVMNETGDKVIAVVLVSFDVRWLKSILSDYEISDGYLELQQGRQSIASRGAAAHRQGVAAKITVIGSRWRLAYWPAGGNLQLTVGTDITMMIAQIVVVLLLVGVVFYLVRIRRIKLPLASLKLKRKSSSSVLMGHEQAEEELTIDKDIESGAGVLFQSSADVNVEEISEDEVFPRMEGPADIDILADAAELPPIQVDIDEPADDTKVSDSVEDRNTQQLASADMTEAVSVPKTIFRAYDIRGIIDDTLTTDAVYQIGRAIGSVAGERQQQTVVVGRDGRLSGKDLSEALIKGLQASGRDVIFIGTVPTPVLYFATHHLNTGTGVMVTGSHNPSNYNGLKMVIDNETLSGEAIQDLRYRLDKGRLLKGEGSLKTMDVVDEYVKYIRDDVLLFRAPKVVVDCGNGVAGGVAPKVLRELGCEVVELYCDVDGHFPNHHPDPAKPENLQDLIEAVKKEGASLGFAFDGDGDRIGVVDSEGNIIWPDRLMMVYARDVLSRNQGAEIVYDVKCTSNLGRIIMESGGRPVMYKTGHSFIKAKMRESGALLAGEMSGHIFFKERYFGFDDAIYAAARLLEAMVVFADDRSTAEAFRELPDALNTPELNILFEEGGNFKFMEQLSKHAQEFHGGVVTAIDGIRVDYQDGWGLVRASNTTPSLVLRFEAKNETALARIQSQFRELMLSIQPDIKLPF